MKAKFISGKSRQRAHRNYITNDGYVAKHEVFRCSTTMNVAESDFVKWAVSKLGEVHKRKQIEGFKSHFEESFVEKMLKEYNENLNAKAEKTMSKEKARIEELKRKKAERMKARFG